MPAMTLPSRFFQESSSAISERLKEDCSLSASTALSIEQDLRNFDHGTFCEKENPKNTNVFVAQPNRLCYKKAACVSPIES